MKNRNLLTGLAILGAVWWFSKRSSAQSSAAPAQWKPVQWPNEELAKYPEPWTNQSGNYWTDARGNIVPARIVAMRQ